MTSIVVATSHYHFEHSHTLTQLSFASLEAVFQLPGLKIFLSHYTHRAKNLRPQKSGQRTTPQLAL